MNENDPGRDPGNKNNNPSPDQAFEDWYKNTIQANPDRFDTNVSKDQWKAWFPLWTGSGFSSSKVDTSGNAIQGNFDNPDQCPPGTAAYKQNMCAPPGYGQVGGAGGSDASASAAPATPPQPLTLQDMLNQMFTQRAGIFGYQGGRTPYAQQFQGLFGVDQNGKPLPNAPSLTSKSLSGGGLIWAPSGTDLSGFGGGGPTPMPAQTPNQNPGQQSNFWNILNGQLSNQNFTQQPQSPLVNALNNSTPPNINSQNINRAQPSNVLPMAAGPTSLTDVLSGTNMFGKKSKTSPLSQIFQGY